MLDVGHQEISKTNSKRWLEVRVRKKKTSFLSPESRSTCSNSSSNWRWHSSNSRSNSPQSSSNSILTWRRPRRTRTRNSPPPPRRGKKKKPFRVCIHGQALKDCELSAGKSRCQELIFFRIRLRGGDMACYQRKHPGNNFLTWLSEG